eukprot:TRINITY_DN5963_c0_g1_i1.p1 TRINITY_DN5963_c0_g1~~TRINITY_DN5963_c0_g1_i1.p1  ORF type:complete len:779 (+),score=246.31 TRINITY_DN5963_c0_g1_i1:55-2391(+)
MSAHNLLLPPNVRNDASQVTSELVRRVDVLSEELRSVAKQLAGLQSGRQGTATPNSAFPSVALDICDTHRPGKPNLSVLIPSSDAASRNEASATSVSPLAVDLQKTGRIRDLLDVYESLAGAAKDIGAADIAPLLPADVEDDEVAMRLADAGATDGRLDCSCFLRFFDTLTTDRPQVCGTIDARVQLVRTLRRPSGERGSGPRAEIRKFLVDSKRREVLFPDTTWRWVLDSLLLLVVLVDAADVLMSWGGTGWYFSGGEPPAAAAVTWTAVSLVLFSVETFLCAKTVKRDGWAVVEDLGKIRSAYVGGWFAVDLLFLVPTDLVFACLSMRTAFRVARVPKLLRVVRVPSLLFQVASPVATPPKTVTLMLVFFWASSALMFYAVLWVVIGGGAEYNTGAEELTAALYFTLTTISTVGYGDIHPVTLGERWYAMLLQLSGLCFMTYVGARGTVFLLETTPQAEMMKDRRRRLAALFRDYDIPWELQAQCFAILPSVAESSDASYGSLLNDLPPWMRDQIESFAKVRALQRVPLFRSADTDALLRIASSLRKHVASPGECIVRRDEQGTDMYIIMNGCVEVTAPADDGEEKWVATLRDGSWFGEAALLYDTCRSVSVRTITVCTLWTLDKGSFLQVAEDCPEFGEALQEDLSRRHFWDTRALLTERARAEAGARPNPLRKRTRLMADLPAFNRRLSVNSTVVPNSRPDRLPDLLRSQAAKSQLGFPVDVPSLQKSPKFGGGARDDLSAALLTRPSDDLKSSVPPTVQECGKSNEGAAAAAQ